MLDWLRNLIAKKYLGSAARTLLAALSGALLYAELKPEVVQEFIKAADPVVSGLLAYGLAQFWSWLEKYKR